MFLILIKREIEIAKDDLAILEGKAMEVKNLWCILPSHGMVRETEDVVSDRREEVSSDIETNGLLSRLTPSHNICYEMLSIRTNARFQR